MILSQVISSLPIPERESLFELPIELNDPAGMFGSTTAADGILIEEKGPGDNKFPICSIRVIEAGELSCRFSLEL